MIPAGAVRRAAPALVASALAAVAVALPDSAALPLAVAAIAGWIGWQDLADLTIPDGAVVLFALLAVVARHQDAAAWGVAPADVAMTGAIDILLCGGAFWAVREAFYRLRGHDGLGFGDVKLAAAGGLLVGAPLFWSAVVLASLAGLAVVALRRLPSRRQRTGGREVGAGEARIAFGALLAPVLAAIFAAQFAGLLPAAMG